MTELSWWFAPHPDWEPGEDWPQEVPVVWYETDDEILLIDPFLPRDGNFDHHGKPVRVQLTQPAHYRGTADFVERYGASVWVPPARPVEEASEPGDDQLPSGVEAIELEGEPQQVVFFFRDQATLVTGDPRRAPQSFPQPAGLAPIAWTVQSVTAQVTRAPVSRLPSE
jgi:hypothetical protein